MKRLMIAVFTLACFTLTATAQESGRTDGAEGSEYGKGGNPFGYSAGRIYLSGAFGSGFFGPSSQTQTGFLYGVDLGYEAYEWIGVQASYAHLTDRDTDIFSLGTNFCYEWRPFVYNLSLQAGVYDQDIAGRHFGLAPGAGLDIVLGEKVRLGINYKHDFIFTDNRTTDLDRVYASLKFYF